MKSETKSYGHWNLTIFSNGTARLWHPNKRKAGENLKRVQRNGNWTWVFGSQESPVHGSLVRDLEIAFMRIGGQS
jgi:hypothetical protein